LPLKIRSMPFGGSCPKTTILVTHNKRSVRKHFIKHLECAAKKSWKAK
jgi:hypothetical protein